MQGRISFILFISLVSTMVNGDTYLHNMRGSNNRLDEANRDRNNANRLFDSQNNDRGGYNVGSLFYYVGSVVTLEWTNQHGGGANGKTHSDLIIQYMCDSRIRDGTVTDRIPLNDNECYLQECDNDLEYGRHESQLHYEKCNSRERNKGLFTADQNLKGDSAIYTRQDNNGNRYGYECPEERDYYPYWHPSPWKDIAILTDRPSRCAFYQAESQNVKDKGVCMNTITGEEIITIGNPELCTAELNNGTWVEVGAHNIPAPECLMGPWTRDNHLGNTFGGQTPRYNWTIPDDVNNRCVLRFRYNISTDDYNGWDPNINSTLNDSEGLKLNLTEKYGAPNPYPFITNPEVDFGIGTNLELNVNTDQFGRTFQDRSHTFSIQPRPDNVPKSAVIKNLNVRGMRGNIVQVYPSVEYDFVPNNMVVRQGEYLHYQHTGSNTQPRNNDGQGLEGTDRSNIAFIQDGGKSYPESVSRATLFDGNGMLEMNARSGVLFSTLGSAESKGQLGGELSELDDASPYYNGGLVLVTSSTGTYDYLGTRNNNFSNRSQKGRLVVVPAKEEKAEINYGALIGGLVGAVGAAALIIGSALLVQFLRTKPRKDVGRLPDVSYQKLPEEQAPMIVEEEMPRTTSQAPPPLPPHATESDVHSARVIEMPEPPSLAYSMMLEDLKDKKPKVPPSAQ